MKIFIITPMNIDQIQLAKDSVICTLIMLSSSMGDLSHDSLPNLEFHPQSPVIAGKPSTLCQPHLSNQFKVHWL